MKNEVPKKKKNFQVGNNALAQKKFNFPALSGRQGPLYASDSI
jgi:hypothetical protein